MKPELLPGAKIPSTVLTGDAERQYIDRLLRIIRAARLNLYYPDARAVRAHIEAMGPKIHQGLYDGIEINLKSGLPTYKTWTRVQTDVTLAPDQLRQLGPREAMMAKAKPGTIHEKQLKKIDYYTKLIDRPLATLGSMNVALKRIDPDTQRAWFHVVLDKLDVSGLFVRYVIELSQQSAAFTKQVVTLDDETASHTEEFQSLIYQFTSLDAEFTFTKLNAIAGLEVERVAKGVIGPFYFTPEHAPEILKPLLAAQQGGFIAMCALDMVADDIADERNNDPLSSFFVERLSQEAQLAYQKGRERTTYKCFKDRKFIVPRTLKRAVHEFCLERQTKNIIYTI